jgi:hypothetical protein
MSLKALLVLFFLTVGSLLLLGQNRSTAVPTTCAVTRVADSFVPPWPYSGRRSSGHFWFGTDRLWTLLPNDGSWSHLSHYTPDDPSFRQKLFFWSQGYDPKAEPRPNLRVTGQRLDSAAPALQTDSQANGGWTEDDQFIVTGLNFPSTGCWKITARYAQDVLTFTVWVAP